MSFVRSSQDSAEGEGQVIAAGDLQTTITSETMNTRGLRKLEVEVNLTRAGGGVTAVQMFPESSQDGTNFAIRQDKEETATPVKVLDTEQLDKSSIAGNIRWSVELDVNVAKNMRLRFTATTPAAGDVIDVNVYGTK